MINLAIADDEPIVLNGLQKIINWSANDYSLKVLAQNGQEALEAVQDLDLDVLITDIQMPILDGLELIREVKNIKPEIICIILTNYDSFEYAKESIEIGAFAYLLKPVDIDELTAILSRAKEYVVKQKKREMYLSFLEKNYRSPHNSIKINKTNSASIQYATQYILENYNRSDLSLLQVAELIGYESTYFSKLFKKVNNINFSDYLTKLRISKAATLLKTGQYTAKEVCFIVGYENYPHFSYTFKKNLGKSPTEYIK